MRVWIIGLAVLGTGCAFIDPVWEFSTQPSADGGRDGGQPPRSDAGDGGVGEDAELPGDAGPVGPGVCRDCTFGTDEGCPAGYGCYLTENAGVPCTVCVERTGVNAGLGEACAGGPDCQPGGDCIANRCRTFCDAPADCEAGVACLQFSPDALTGWCVGADCDPFDQSTCGNPQACAIVSTIHGSELAAICADRGSVPLGGDCSVGPCAPGLVCVGGALVCVQLCDGLHGCSSGECLGIGTLAASPIGVCGQPCENDEDCDAGGVCTANLICLAP